MRERPSQAFGKVTGACESLEFSLVAGGPLYRTLENLHLVRNGFALLPRGIVAIVVVTWVPLLIIELIQWQDTHAMSLLREADVHIRFLIVLSLLIATESVAHSQLQPILSQFISREIITGKQSGQFKRLIARLHNVRDSWIPETVLLIFAYTAGIWIRRYFEVGSATISHAMEHLWYRVISIPFFQFILFRWYLRYSLWFWFLWKVSALHLRLIPTHPDCSAGLSFVGRSVYVFAGVAVAHTILLSACIASEIWNKGGGLQDYGMIVGTTCAIVLCLILAPSAAFAIPLLHARRECADMVF